ncbi:hypothetical protein KTE49_23640 [Burkholderia multivorans]|uniref:hypothetical protein n=1 Tax=Burkholderia multivorans TaxID=87883 RepID=UPI0011B1E9C1|nr:hypothetical protein [Burkholderia multivorans]MBJ9617756.1 hypothetical protein [Burkholderia multivorans]MBU9330330.1 hypothetical protein [Burkholderia multivorans]MBU9533428.1 hypothetical protein [Burkholderia multivorans]
MTNISLAQRFQEARAPKIEVDGRDIYSLYEIDVSSGETVLYLDFVSYKKSTIQGVNIKASNCNVEISNQILTDFVIWMDHSPKHIPLNVTIKNGGKATLKVWNVWECDDVSHAWIGNAGMLVKKEDRHIAFHCSDGTGESDFEDLVFTIDVGKVTK